MTFTSNSAVACAGVIASDRDCPELSWGLKGRRFSSSVL